jgi:hypothetical protein
MKSTMIILSQLMIKAGLTSIIGTFFYVLSVGLTISVILLEKEFNPFYDNPSIFLLFTYVANITLLTGWSRVLSNFIRHQPSRLLPGFDRTLLKVHGILLLLTVVIPCSLVVHAPWFSFTVVLLILFSYLVIMAISTLSQLLGAYIGFILLFWLLAEFSRVEKHPEVQMFDYLPISINVLLLLFNGALIALIYFQSYFASFIKHSEKPEDTPKEEYSVCPSKKSRVSSYVSRVILNLKLFVYQKLLKIKLDPLTLALWNQQNLGLLFWRWALLLFTLVTLLWGNDFWLGFAEGLGDKELRIVFLILTWGLLGGFDHSVMSRMKFAEKTTWLRYSVDGIEQFKARFINKLSINVVNEVILTTFIYLLILQQVIQDSDLFLYLTLSFVAFKAYSIICSYFLVRFNFKVIGNLVIAFSYAAVILLWSYYTRNNGSYDSSIITVVVVGLIGVITIGYQKLKNMNTLAVA